MWSVRNLFANFIHVPLFKDLGVFRPCLEHYIFAFKEVRLNL